MNLYAKLTDEQIKISNRNNGKARRWFKRNGYMPDPAKIYDLHHIDPNLRYTDINRYIEWNISDLICIEHSEHSKLHGNFKSLTFDVRSDRMRKLWDDPDSILNSKQNKELISNIVKNNHKKENGPYGYEWRKKLSESGRKYWTKDKRLKQSKAVKTKWLDPNSKYHTEDYKIKKSSSHKKCIIITNGFDTLEFKSEYECGLFLGYPTKEKATNMVGWMINKKGKVVTRNSKYRGWEIYRG